MSPRDRLGLGTLLMVGGLAVAISENAVLVSDTSGLLPHTAAVAVSTHTFGVGITVYTHTLWAGLRAGEEIRL